MVVSIAPGMANQVSAVAAPQGQQLTLDQERERWFSLLDSYKRSFEARKENLHKAFEHDQPNLCHDLDEQARFIEAQGLTRQVSQLFRDYQAEIRTRRLSERKQVYEAGLQELAKEEKDVFYKHQMEFPLQPSTSMLSRSAANSSTGTTPTASVTRGQTPSIHMQATQTLPHPQRPNLQATNSINSAPMPTQLNSQWQGYAQVPPQHATPHVQTQQTTPQIHSQHTSPQRRASMYQQPRPMNQIVEAPPRMLPSNGRAPFLGNGVSGSAQNSATGSAYGQHAGSPRPMNAEIGRGSRVAISPVNQATQGSRDDRMQLVRNGTHLTVGRQDDLVRHIQHDPHRQLKRKSESSELASNPEDPRAKRPRTGTPQSMAQFTIKFNEVYQDGKAKFKHTIIKFEDVYYILKCDQHGVHFKQNALAAAAKHLHGASHNHQKKEHRLALRTIGYHVVDCTEELMNLNNDVVKKAFEGGYKPLNQLHGPKSGGKRHSGGDLPERSTEVPTALAQSVQNSQSKKTDTTQYITNPEPGQLYLAKWNKSNKMYVVAVLGWTDLSQCGWTDKFCDLSLYKQKPRPSCFEYNDEGIAGWAEGYGDGEPRVMNREVPVMWFEDRGDNRLGWVNVQLLKPFLLDDPNRSANPDASQNRARQWYAEIRGYRSYEDMVAGKLADERQTPVDEEMAAPQLPSSASDSDLTSQDVDMYDFGDNPPKIDDSDDEDYIDHKRLGKDSDDDMADAESSKSPQPLRRSTQEVRPSSRLSDSLGFGRSGAAAGTRSSAKKDTPVVDRTDMEMRDAQGTPTKSRPAVESLETTTPSNVTSNVVIPSVALGTPATPRPEGDAREETVEDSTQPDDAPSQPKPKSGIDNTGEKSLSVSTNGNAERSGTSKSPSVEKEMPKVSPKLQVANLLNSIAPENEKAREQASSTVRTVPADDRRPLPSQGQTAAQPASLGHTLPAKPHVEVEPKQHESSTRNLSIEVAPRQGESGNGQNGDASKQPSPIESPRSASADSASRRSDPRMSISRALDDQDRQQGEKPTISNGIASSSSTPRIINLANDERWRAVRKSKSPLITPATIISPLIDRSAAASPMGGVSRSADSFSIDVGSFSEGDKRWDGEGTKFLHFVIEDDARGVARSRAEDGMEAILDAQQVKGAQQDRTTVKLILKTGVEQRFKFAANAVTGSTRGGQPQATKFYRWVTGKNVNIEHLG